jgi:hypothetical protein
MPVFEFPYNVLLPDGRKETRVIRVAAETFEDALLVALERYWEREPG